MTGRPRVMLVTPPYHCGVVESAGRWPNLALLTLAGELRRAGFEPIVYDAMGLFDTVEQVERRLAEERPDVVAATAITATSAAAVDVLRRARALDPRVTTVLGGVDATFRWRDILREHHETVDACVIGEGEITLPELVEASRAGGDPLKVPGVAAWREGAARAAAPRPFIQDLDRLRPTWDLVDWNDYPLYFIENSRVAIVSTSRGCIYSCGFCSQHEFWKGTYRQRRPEAVVAEMEDLRARGVNVFFLSDEYPTRNRARWERLLDLLIERDLGADILLETCAGDIVRDEDLLPRYRRAGVLFVYIGVEAGIQERLDALGKNLRVEVSEKAVRLIRDAGMICESSLIVGLPEETPESMRATLDLAFRYSPDYMHFLYLTPWPYAAMYPSLEPYIEDRDLSHYNLVTPILRPRAMSRAEMEIAVLDCYRRYYARQAGAWRTMPPGRKKDCLIRGMQAILQHSFLRAHHGGLGKMPEDVRRLLDPASPAPPAEKFLATDVARPDNVAPAGEGNERTQDATRGAEGGC